MPTEVSVSPKTLTEYAPYVSDDRLEEIRALAEPLRGATVLHLNATAYGGGVAEILGSFIPLLRDLGIEADWQVMDAAPEFFNLTKRMHNALQGMPIEWDDAAAAQWQETNDQNAAALSGKYDYVYIHDPQPAGILRSLRKNNPNALGAKWIWRCHLDTTDAIPEVWGFVRDQITPYDAVVFTLAEYVKEPLRGPHVEIIWPAIDPTSAKNADLSDADVRKTLEKFAVDPRRPMIAQISRFDPWKDPLGVLDVYKSLKEKIPELQLAMIASMADDDPEAWAIQEQIIDKAGADNDIHTLTNLNGVGSGEVNAFQRGANVVMQKSIREGFGLVVSEALWKSKAFVGSEAGGIPLQLDYGRVGRIASTTQGFADAIEGLLKDDAERTALGDAGREQVRDNFLTTRLLRDHLRLMNALAADDHPSSRQAQFPSRTAPRHQVK